MDERRDGWKNGSLKKSTDRPVKHELSANPVRAAELLAVREAKGQS